MVLTCHVIHSKTLNWMSFRHYDTDLNFDNALFTILIFFYTFVNTPTTNIELNTNSNNVV